MNDCEEILRPALSEAAQLYSIESEKNFCKVVTPFQHSNGDLVTLWVQRKAGDFYQIRDHGETFAMLRLYGVDPHTSSREKRLEKIQSQFNLEETTSEIRLRAPEGKLPQRLMDAIQAVQAISHLIYKHRTNQPTQFKSEVEDFLIDVGYSIETPYKTKGETQRREFDFGVNHRDPKVLLDTIHTNDEYNLKQQADNVLLNWHEIQSEEYKHGAIVDDVGGIYREDILDSIIDNLDYHFRWTEKERITQEITIKP